MASIRSTYTISEKAKENTDFLKKQYKTNISELVDTLLKFDENSIEKIFEMYQKMNPKTIEKWNRLETQKGLFVWNPNQMKMIKTFPLNEIDNDMINIAALELENLSNSTAPKEYVKMIKSQQTVSEATLNLVKNLEKQQKEIDDLKKDIVLIKNK